MLQAGTRLLCWLRPGRQTHRMPRMDSRHRSLLVAVVAIVVALASRRFGQDARNDFATVETGEQARPEMLFRPR